MSQKALRYLELLKLSGIDEVFIKKKKQTQAIFLKKEKAQNKSQILLELKKKYSNCKKCKLWQGRIKFVYGEGNADADLMLIGEGPGADENITGRPFVGKAGQLLNKMLKAININREDVYIANIVKCRPPDNRDPQPDEKEKCMPYLLEQIEIIRPKILLLLGKVSATTLFERKENLTYFRTNTLYFQSIRTFTTYHPAALLRNPHWKKNAWTDLQKLQKEYESIKK